MRSIRHFLFAMLVATTGVAHSEALRNVTLEVKGMHCASCPLTVKILLKKQPGVEEVKMDATKHTAEVRFDPSKVSTEQLARVVSEAGYPTKPLESPK